MPRSIVLLLLGGVLCLAFAALAATATGGPEQAYFLGEPWEAGIVRGVEIQRQAERRRMPPATILGRAERAARRDPTVVKLYLLARAYGLNAQWQRNQLAGARTEAAKAKCTAAAGRAHAAAMATYREVVQKAPRCYFAYHDMGIMEMLRKEPDKRVAFGYFSNAYQINKRYTPTQRQLIEMYVRGKQFKEALPLLRRLIQLEPEDEDARVRMVVALGELKQYPEAYTLLAGLRKKDPESPNYKAMEAHLDVSTARYERAIATYKGLARSNPNVPTAFLGIVDCVKSMEAKGMSIDLNDFLFALKGLRRMMRDPKQQRELTERIRRVEHAMAQPAGAPTDKPTTAQLLHALKSPDEGMRLRALIQLMLREEPATRDVLRSVAPLINPATEPQPAVRAGAVRCLGRMSGTALIPLVRMGLSDSDSRVRLETADTLVAIAKRDSNAAGVVIAILGRHVDDRELQVSSSARLGILQLAAATLTGVGDTSADAAHREAFRRWWRSPAGENAQIDALDSYHRVKDRAAHQVLVPYLRAPSYHVFRAAYDALRKSASFAGTEALRGWHAAMPAFADDRWTKANWQNLKQSVDAWVASQPGS